MSQFSPPTATEILDALPDRLSVLDCEGIIVQTNRSWRDFARDNGDPELKTTCEGINYLAICERTTGNLEGDARTAYDGIKGVLSGEITDYEQEYPCEVKGETRWFLLRAVPLVMTGIRYAVIEHTDITARRLAQQRAQQQQTDALHAAEETAQQLTETLSLERVSRQSPGTSENFPVFRASGKQFDEAVSWYGRLLETALESRAYKTEANPEEVERFGQWLAHSGAVPRDVIQIHMAALKETLPGSNVSRTRAYHEEGRVLLIEIMGHLALTYRKLGARG